MPADRKPDGHGYGFKFMPTGTGMDVILNPMDICSRAQKNGIRTRKPARPAPMTLVYGCARGHVISADSGHGHGFIPVAVSGRGHGFLLAGMDI